MQVNSKTLVVDQR